MLVFNLDNHTEWNNRRGETKILKIGMKYPTAQAQVSSADFFYSTGPPPLDFFREKNKNKQSLIKAHKAKKNKSLKKR